MIKQVSATPSIYSNAGVLFYMIQSRLQARAEKRYNSISEFTVGIIFLGTPHQ